MKSKNKLTSDHEETGLQLLQENNALALETTSEDDENSSRGDGSTKLGRLAVGLARGQRLRNIIRLVVLG